MPDMFFLILMVNVVSSPKDSMGNIDSKSTSQLIRFSRP